MCPRMCLNYEKDNGKTDTKLRTIIRNIRITMPHQTKCPSSWPLTCHSKVKKCILSHCLRCASQNEQAANVAPSLR